MATTEPVKSAALALSNYFLKKRNVIIGHHLQLSRPVLIALVAFRARVPATRSPCWAAEI